MKILKKVKITALGFYIFNLPSTMIKIISWEMSTWFYLLQSFAKNLTMVSDTISITWLVICKDLDHTVLVSDSIVIWKSSQDSVFCTAARGLVLFALVLLLSTIMKSSWRIRWDQLSLLRKPFSTTHRGCLSLVASPPGIEALADADSDGPLL